MSQLSPESQALLDAGRQALSPNAATKAKVLGAVEAKLASGAAAGGLFAAGKLWLALALVTGMGGGAYLAVSGSTTGAPAARVEAPREVALQTVETKSGPSATVAVVEATSDEPPTVAAPQPVRQSRKLAKPRRPRRKVAPVQVETSAQALKSERTLIAAAQVAIRKEEFLRARTVLSEHKKRYPDGILSPERQAATAIVHCLAPVGTNGKAIARRFLEAHPTSPLAGRVRSQCMLK